jgi:hypothetical protein
LPLLSLISKGQILSINPFWYFYHKPRIYHKTRSLVGNSLDGSWGWRSWVCIPENDNNNILKEIFPINLLGVPPFVFDICKILILMDMVCLFWIFWVERNRKRRCGQRVWRAVTRRKRQVTGWFACWLL